MENINISIENVLNFVTKEEIHGYHTLISEHYQALVNNTGEGNDFLGWVTLPSKFDNNLILDIQKTADNIRKIADILVVVGIGGSYLGARAVIESLSHNFNQLLSKEDRKSPLILYAGQNIGEDYLSDLFDVLKGKSYAVVVISKSGTTTEPAIAFRLLKNDLEERFGKAGAKERIIAITDKEKGALKKMSDKEGYKTFEIPDNIGGRYSVLTPVGLLPIAISGINIKKLIDGAVHMENIIRDAENFENNPAGIYAASRQLLYRNGKTIEIMASFIPNLYYLIEWWKQLYGESEGKNGKGIFPAGVIFTTDLHSMGQYIQDGMRNIFETVISVKATKKELRISSNAEDLDGLNYIAGKKIDDVNKMAELGTIMAHNTGKVPVLKITIPELNEEYIGQLIYFFEIACGLSGYVMGVNPFDQPGVEAYKKNMFSLLGKPGYK
ncbi:MAG: glucose-6-phosphate isomerase [Bacteroidota bacterium]|nr:glucose-6-phosphate isomerase [Bacteroidota bacterium]